MRTETEEIRDNLKYLSLLARDYPSQAAAASEIISTQALLKLPKGTEHFMSDLHGENEAFVHILNSASGVIREKVDIVLGDTVPEGTRAELATLIYYPNEKLPQLKERCADEEALEQWYSETLLRLIDICRLVSSKHTREHVRACLPSSCGYILDELLHAHFEDHDKDLYYGQIVGSIIENGRADKFVVRLCELIKRLAVDKLHIVGDLFDRGPRPDVILDLLMRHHDVDIQWGNHDVVWMGAAAGSPICICTVLKTTLAYHNHGMVEDCYGINLRHLQRMAEQFYGDDDLTIWMPHTDTARGPYTPGMLHRCAVMHKAITILMLKLECQVIDRNPDFKMQGRDFLRRINWVLWSKAKAQVRKNKSINATLHYTINDDGIIVSQGEQEAKVKWYQIRKTVVVKNAIYIYMSPVRAFIFTKNQCGEDFSDLVNNIQKKVEQYKDYEPEEDETDVESGGTDE